MPDYRPTKGIVVWPNGAIAETFSADKPDQLRGPQFTGAWCDEIAAWQRGPETWDNLAMGMRIGDNPQVVITSTPKPVQLVKDLIKDPLTVVTRGTTYDNKGNLSPKFWKTLVKYEGTRIGRQELLAELLDDIEGALWTLALIEQSRIDSAKVPPLVRVVIAIDPAVSSNPTSAETGIVAVGLSDIGHLYVLEDVSGRYSPLDWAKKACRLMLKWNADRIVGEVNNGGDLVEANIRGVLSTIPFRSVRASRGKQTRAEPVSALYEQRRVHHVWNSDDPANLAELETQMTTWVPSTGEKSPDRMDALVWAATDLLVAPEEHYFATVDPHVQVSPY
jgi:phage terminase large subunit-like protein